MDKTKLIEIKNAIISWCQVNMYEEFSCFINETCKECIKRKFNLSDEEMKELNLA